MGLDLLETIIDGFQRRRKKTEGKKRREKKRNTEEEEERYKGSGRKRSRANLLFQPAHRMEFQNAADTSRPLHAVLGAFFISKHETNSDAFFLC
jgi:hypothetical protein